MSMKDIALGRYIHGDSLIHRLDPRAKLLSLFAVMAAVVASSDKATVAAGACFTIFACLLTGLGTRLMLRSLTPFFWLIVITVVLNLLFTGGHIVVPGPLPYGGITSEGIAVAILNGGRIVVVVVLAAILTLTTEPVTLVDGIELLLAPLKAVGVRPGEIALSMVITIRFIPLLIDEAEKIRKSHRARGLRPGGSIARRLHTLPLLFLPLFHAAFRRADALAAAMECRLYRPDAERTSLVEMRFAALDYLALGICCIAAIVIVFV